MNKISQFLRLTVTLTTFLLSACGAAIATSTPGVGGGKVEPIPVAFIGFVESIAGDQWVINGKTVTVAPDSIQNGPFSVGDQVKVEGLVNADGSFIVSSVEVPTPQDASRLPPFGDDSSGAGNENNSNENEANENSSNANGANENGSNENEGNENSANENSSNENEANENEGNENESNENESNENSSNENESNENENNENESNVNSSNGNESNENEGNENRGGNENGGGENEENENESNGNED